MQVRRKADADTGIYSNICTRDCRVERDNDNLAFLVISRHINHVIPALDFFCHSCATTQEFILLAGVFVNNICAGEFVVAGCADIRF